MSQDEARRSLPGVDRVLEALNPDDLQLPHPMVASAIRRVLGDIRKSGAPTTLDQVLDQVREQLHGLKALQLQPILNGTGIVIHTNLGRSPLSEIQFEHLRPLLTGYTNLELNIVTGKRGKRGDFGERALAMACGAEAATAANNCAAALVLILRALASNPEKNEVIISRGELVEIGGGFRIPEVMETSGAVLREVGATNKTNVGDYERAITDRTAMILKVHRSNFRIVGFTESAEMRELAKLGKKHGLPVVEDLGSGAMLDTAQIPGLDHEPTPKESIEQGADLVCFSGDKLFGGAQAGIIAGTAKMITTLKREPFFRALRCDKITLALIEKTITSYLSGTAPESVGTQKLLRIPAQTLRTRAEQILTQLGNPESISIVETYSSTGGGCMPESQIPSISLRFEGAAKKIQEHLRHHRPCVIGYIESDAFFLDLRTIFPGQDSVLMDAIRSVK